MNLFDAAITLLLVFAIFVTIKLYRRINKVQSLSENVSIFLKKFGYHTQQIANQVLSLERTSNECVSSDKLPQMLSLRDDFDILLEHAEKLASRLDRIIDDAIIIEEKLKKSVYEKNHNMNKFNSSFGDFKNDESLHEKYRSNVSLLSALKGVR